MATRKRRTIEEIIEMGQEAIGDQIALLVAEARPLDGAEARMLCDYLRAALGVRKDTREQALCKDLGDIRDDELTKLVAKDMGCPPSSLQWFIDTFQGRGGCPPEALQDFIDQWKTAGQRAS